jgi:hypothetical protein
MLTHHFYNNVTSHNYFMVKHTHTHTHNGIFSPFPTPGVEDQTQSLVLAWQALFSELIPTL